MIRPYGATFKVYNPTMVAQKKNPDPNRGLDFC